MPGEILADAACGSDENVQDSAAAGVDLVAPVLGNTPKGDAMTIGAFEVDAKRETVQKCPAGYAPQNSEYNPQTGTTRTVMDPDLCAGCTMQAGCPIKQTCNGARLDHTDKERRLDERRREEKTDEFRERYKKRSGIEATNSGIKRRTGMERVGIRGKKQGRRFGFISAWGNAPGFWISQFNRAESPFHTNQETHFPLDYGPGLQP
ncbi:MAG: transposase [Candidatus Hydrogenedentes bacterium]|nr:transposase [Candidatus Hydrogenedentota bacterium]